MAIRVALIALLTLTIGCYDDGAVSSGESSEESSPFIAEGWSLEAVESTTAADPYGGGAYNSLAFDPLGNPAISYIGGGSLLKLARRQGAGWTYQTIDSLAAGNGPGSTPTDGGSLAFSAAGVPMIAYGKKGVFYFAQLIGSTWSKVAIDQNGGGGSLVLDAGGQPTIAFMSGGSSKKGGSPGGIKLAKRVGSTWTTEVVDALGGGYISLAYDSSGQPAIAYQQGPSTVKLARKSGATWTIQVVESGGTNWGRNTTLAFNPITGHPAIYHGAVTFNSPPQPAKRFLQWDGSAWVAESAVSTTGGLTSAFGGNVTFEPDGTPIVSYQFVTDSFDNKFIRFARRVGGVWEHTDVAQSTSLGPAGTPLVYNGAPSMAFRANGTLYYARFVGP